MVAFARASAELASFAYSLDDHTFQFDRLDGREIKITRNNRELNGFGFAYGSLTVGGDKLEDGSVVWSELKVE